MYSFIVPLTETRRRTKKKIGKVNLPPTPLHYSSEIIGLTLVKIVLANFWNQKT